MNENPNSESLAKYASDMGAAEQHLLEAIKIQQEDENLKLLPAALEVLTDLRPVVEAHLAALHQLTDEFGAGSRAHFKETITSITGAALGIASKLRMHPASKILRDNYVTLNTNAIGYTMLHTTGLALGSPATAEVALRHLKNITPFIFRLSQVVIPVVVQELSGTARVDLKAAQWALMNTREAWKND